MPSLRALYTKKEEIPADTANFYVEKEGKFVLSVDPADGFALEDVSGLKSALGAERNTAETLKNQMKAFEGIDAKAAKAALKKVQEFANLDPEQMANEKFEAAKGQLVQQFETEKTGWESEKQILEKNLNKFALSQRASSAIAKAGGSVDLLLPHVMGQLRLHRNGDDIDVRVVDNAGNPRIANAAGDLMSVDGLIGDMKNNATFASAFKADTGSGSGIGDGGGGGGTRGRITLEMTDAQKEAEIARRLGV